MKPENQLSGHAIGRAWQRWGVSISIAEIEQQLASGTAIVYERQTPIIWKILIEHEGSKIPLVYNTHRKAVITVLPRAESNRLRQELGLGLSKEARREFYRSMTSRELARYERWKREQEILDPNFNAALVRKAKKRMARVDNMPADVRNAIHEYGLEIVWEFWLHRVRNGDDIAILIEASRKAPSAYSKSLLPLYRHFGVSDEYKAIFLATAARNEPAPAAPTQKRFAQNRPPNRRGAELLRSESPR